MSTYCVHVVLRNTFAATEVEYGKVRNRFGGMVRSKGGLLCKGRVNSVSIAVITEIKYSFYIQVFYKYMYNVKTSDII